jgi:hypothetical protein
MTGMEVNIVTGRYSQDMKSRQLSLPALLVFFKILIPSQLLAYSLPASRLPQNNRLSHSFPIAAAGGEQIPRHCEDREVYPVSKDIAKFN